MIGFYSYTVILTYCAAAAAVVGMTQVSQGNIRNAIFCLMISGVCDMFDGKIARSKKNRTNHEKVFGIQIDSLSDVVCFGMFPAIINCAIGGNSLLSIISSVAFVICAIIRLGFFNVMEEERQRTSSENMKNYHGLPVTSAAIILPIMYLMQNYITQYYEIIFSAVMLIVAFLFILDFKMKKPNNKEAIFIIAVAIIIIVALTTRRV